MEVSSDSKCPLMCEDSQCPVVYLLRALLDKMETHQISINEELKTKTGSGRPQVNDRVLALVIKHREKIWTSDALAKEIGCTGSAVRLTPAWKGYQKQLQSEKQARQPHKGYKDKAGNIDAYYSEMDERDE